MIWDDELALEHVLSLMKSHEQQFRIFLAIGILAFDELVEIVREIIAIEILESENQVATEQQLADEHDETLVLADKRLVVVVLLIDWMVELEVADDSEHTLEVEVEVDEVEVENTETDEDDEIDEIINTIIDIVDETVEIDEMREIFEHDEQVEIVVELICVDEKVETDISDEMVESDSISDEIDEIEFFKVETVETLALFVDIKAETVETQ